MPEPSIDHARRTIRVVGYLLLVVATVAGAVGLYELLTEGHLHEATTLHVPWGLWVAGYIFFLGLSAGSFLVSALPYVFGVRRLEPIGPLALIVSLMCLLLAGMLIMADLGHPERMHKVLLSLNPTSPMAWMSVLYNFYIAVVLGQLYFALRLSLVARLQEGQRPRWLFRLLTLGSRRTDDDSVRRDHRWLRRLGVAGILVTVVLLWCEGSIFAVAKARPNWFGGLLPVVILISALASGGALLTLLSAVSCRVHTDLKADLVRWLAIFTVGVLAVETLMLASEILTVLYGGILHETHAWMTTITGPYAVGFWGVQIGLGVVLPAMIVALPATRRRVGWLGLAGLLVVVGMMVTRWNIVIPAQLVASFEGLGEAYHHARFQEGYFPSRGEWLVALGVAALGGWMFLVASRLLPLDGLHHASIPEGAE
ncbi:MAG: hypothetical protein FJ288_04460 [Planctomycetes bacterium]|nr:hypothetical protein [Planctomycetota bacterium]